MRVRAMAFRIINELRHDKRSLMLVFIAPILLLTLVYFILDNPTMNSTVGIINCPQVYVDALYENNISPIKCSESEGIEGLEGEKFVATVRLQSNKLSIMLDGSNVAKAEKTLAILQAAAKGVPGQPEGVEPDITYIYGAADLSAFNNMGSTLIGVLVFFFVFLLAGISFLKERTTGTMEKLLSTPIRRWEIVTGYALGYGFITAIQSIIITLYVVYILDVMMIGSIWYVFLITLLTALTALTLGILLSTAASNEFQMVQFIPLVVVPQIFFCGLFDLSPAFSAFGKIMPLYYTADALNQVMLRGNGIEKILPNLLILMACSVFFIFANTLLLKKYRRI